MHLIKIPDTMTIETAVTFWEGAGYRLGKNFQLNKLNRSFIVRNQRVIMAQDAIALGFKFWSGAQNGLETKTNK